MIRLTKKKKDLLEFAGKWKDSGDGIVKVILEGRKADQTMPNILFIQ